MTLYTNLDDVPRGQYGCIYADPAWKHVSYSIKGEKRSPSSHYRVMSLDEIAALPVRELAAKDCHLMMWTTQPHLEQSFAIMRAWGFRYSSVFNFWIKLNPRAADELFITMKDFHRGMGFTTRKNVELLLLGRKGSPPRLRKDIPDFLITARRKHSQKPEEMARRIEAYCPGPRLEMFSRTDRPGWDHWGDQVGSLPAVSRKANRSIAKLVTEPTPPPAEPVVPEFLKRMVST